jgi:uncharacterized protein YcbX
VHVQTIAIHPVKGCHRVELDRADVEPWGLAGDRRWLVVDARTGIAITQRDTATLTQIQPVPTLAGLILRTPGLSDLDIDRPAGGPLLDVTVWGFTGPAMAVGGDADEWLSTALGREVRLVWCDDPTRRQVNPRYGLESDRVSFADGYPVSLATISSLGSLNDRIVESDEFQAPVPITRFRSNLVIAGAPPWVEDEWTGARIRVGEVIFRVAKPNDRCLVTTIDQETGVKGHEPLRALGRYRNIDQELRFACYLIPDGPGAVAVGDPVTPL